MGVIERVTLTYIHDYVSHRELVGTCCKAQRAQLGTLEDLELWDGEVRERSRREGMYVYTYLIYFFV